MSESLFASSLADLFSRLASQKAEKGVLWFGISGSWRKTNEEIEVAVRDSVRRIFARGDGIVSGGALGVDYFATDEMLLLDQKAEKIKVFLPVTLEKYATHYRKRAIEGVITSMQAEALISQLEKIQTRNPGALIDNRENLVVDPKTYFERNTVVVLASDALVAFHVNESEGAKDTIDKAIALGKNVFVTSYSIS